MDYQGTVTAFAPAVRAPADVLARQQRAFLDDRLLRQMYEAVSEIVIIVNFERQIVFANSNLGKRLGVSAPEALMGLRPGEAMQCQHACNSSGGCGTAEACAMCGAVGTVLGSQRGRMEERECRLLMEGSGEALELRIRSSPLRYNGEEFVICAITDISHEKRRRALERVFFHDLLNTASGLKMLAAVLPEAKPERRGEIVSGIGRAVSMLVEDISHQRDLAAAESSELQVCSEALNSRELLQGLVETYSHVGGRGRHILMDSATEEVCFVSDKKILGRVIGNMIKNGLEACRRGEAVTVGCRRAGERVEFWVQNPGFITREAQLQLFQRSFSTKGTGRGLGTYSMKLLTERYLKGEVSFTSTQDEGTTFVARYPMVL